MLKTAFMGNTIINNNPLAWKLAGTASGTNTVAMPTDYNEVMLVVTGYSTYYFTMIIPKSEISSTNVYPRFANYYNTSNNAGGYCEVNNSTAKLSAFTENNGNVVVSQATFKLYYR